MTKQTDLAARIATKAHKGQTRWNKSIPYITHPAAIARALVEDGWGEEYVATAWLHDVLEDTDITPQNLLNEGVNPDIVDAVIVMTKRDGVSYLDYILDVGCNSIARNVKMFDIEHNMSDLKKGSMYHKYELALYILERC